jgi:hypothetical protein
MKFTAWAHQTAVADETCTLCVERKESDKTGLIRLAGADPTVGS